MLSDDVIHGSLKVGYPVRDSKRDSANLIEFTIRHERCVWFFFTSDGYLGLGALQVQGTMVPETRNLVDQIIYSRDEVGIEAGESVDCLAVIYHLSLSFAFIGYY